MIAAGLGQPQMVEILLTAGAQVLILDPRAGTSALHKAALSGSPDVTTLLLDHGAFIDQQSPIVGHTALMDAVIYGHEEVACVLLKRNARTSIRKHWDETALDLACRDSHAGIVRLIEERDASDIERIGGIALVPAIKNGDLTEVKCLIATGIPVDTRSRCWRCARQTHLDGCVCHRLAELIPFVEAIQYPIPGLVCRKTRIDFRQDLVRGSDADCVWPEAICKHHYGRAALGRKQLTVPTWSRSTTGASTFSIAFGFKTKSGSAP